MNKQIAPTCTVTILRTLEGWEVHPTWIGVDNKTPVYYRTLKNERLANRLGKFIACSPDAFMPDPVRTTCPDGKTSVHAELRFQYRSLKELSANLKRYGY